MLWHLTAHQIESLNAVGSLVNLGDTGIPNQLFYPRIPNIASAAEDLKPEIRSFESIVRKERFDHRRHEADQVLGFQATGRIGMPSCDIHSYGNPKGKSASALVIGSHGE